MGAAITWTCLRADMHRKIEEWSSGMWVTSSFSRPMSSESGASSRVIAKLRVGAASGPSGAASMKMPEEDMQLPEMSKCAVPSIAGWGGKVLSWEGVVMEGARLCGIAG